ncbi:MAG: hypothetical protein ACK5OQ_15560 [Burkholderiales bacterium]|jgi:hypothetical protein
MSPSIRYIATKVLVLSFIAAIPPACATGPFTIEERDSSLGWTKHTTIVGEKKITFELPPGGNFNPAPNTSPLKFGSIALGGVSYGQRPQGRELSDLMVWIGTRRYVPKLPATGWRDGDFAKWADAEVQDFHALVESKAVIIQQNSWHYQRVTSRKTGLVAQETYKLPFDETSYLLIRGDLGSTYAKPEGNVARAHEILGRMVNSVRIEPRE